MSKSAFLLQTAGGAVLPRVDVWIALKSNNTGTTYKSAARTTTDGLYFHPAPGDTYTVYYSLPGLSVAPASTPPSVDWFATGDTAFSVPYVAGDEIAAKDVTTQLIGPYLPSGYPGGAVSGEIWAPRPNGSDDTTALNNWITSLISAGPGIIGRLWPAPSTAPYIQSGPLTITGAPGLTIQGCGKRATFIKRADNTNQRQIKITNCPGIVLLDLGFDANGALNAVTNQNTISFEDTLSTDAAVERCYIKNSPGFAIWSNFTSNLLRTTNLRFINNDIEAVTGNAVDLLTIVSQGGIVAGNRVNFAAGVGLNVYESNDVSCWGNTVYGSSQAGTGISISSCLACPVVGNTLFLTPGGDTGIQVLKEVDNAFAREQLDALIGKNTFRGNQPDSLCIRLINTSQNIQILGNKVYGANRFILYQSGAVIDNVLAADNQLINVNTFDQRDSTPTNVRYHHNTGGPTSAITTPAFPGTGTDVANTTGYDVTAYITNGTSAITATTVQVLATPVNATHVASGTGGTLLHSTSYFYRVTALNAYGETLASTETSIATPAGADTCSVLVKWAAVTGAVSYNVYGRTTGAELKIASKVAGLSFLDTGSVTPSGALPGANTTGLQTALNIAASAGMTVQIPAATTIRFVYAGGAPTWVWIPNA